MGQVVSLRGSRSRQKTTATKRRRKRAKPIRLPDSTWPAGAVIEVTSIYGEGEANFAHRHRIALAHKGGVAENLYDYGAREYIVGEVSEMISAKKWSKPRLGMVPTETIMSIVLHVEDAPALAPVSVVS